jgi:septation ring formation regulator EzrA
MDEYHAEELVSVLKQIKDELKDLNDNIRYVASKVEDTYHNYENVERKLSSIAGHLETISYK